MYLTITTFHPLYEQLVKCVNGTVCSYFNSFTSDNHEYKVIDHRVHECEFGFALHVIKFPI
jgi:hypothetical protein